VGCCLRAAADSAPAVLVDARRSANPAQVSRASMWRLTSTAPTFRHRKVSGCFSTKADRQNSCRTSPRCSRRWWLDRGTLTPSPPAGRAQPDRAGAYRCRVRRSQRGEVGGSLTGSPPLPSRHCRPPNWRSCVTAVPGVAVLSDGLGITRVRARRPQEQTVDRCDSGAPSGRCVMQYPPEQQPIRRIVVVGGALPVGSRRVCWPRVIRGGARAVSQSH